MSNTYFTVTGLHHYYGDSFLEKEIIVYLKKKIMNMIKKPLMLIFLVLERLGMLPIVLIQYLEKAIVLEDCMIRSVKKRVVKLDSY